MSESNFAQGNAQNFYHEGLSQLNNRVLGEEAAKDALLLAYITGNNLVFVGEPGGGKTTLSSEAHHLISDIEDQNVARVPHHSDLTPNQLIGGSITITKEITVDGKVTTEDQTAKIKPIIHEDTQLIWLDELSRVNPFAVNAVLGALENGKVTTDSGEVTLRGLELAISTMNPSESRQATFPIAAATASRHAIGAVMGGDKSDLVKRGQAMDELFNNWNPGDINPVISTKELHILRESAKYNVAMPEKYMPLAKQLVAGTVDSLAGHGFHEADARITKHIASNARGLALLRGQSEIQERELRDAVRFTLSARLGIMGVRGTTKTNLYESIDAVVRGVIG